MNIFLIPSSFMFFHKNYYHFTKGMEPAQSPKTAVSLPLNPSFLGHGSGLCPKNLLSSKVISVSYNNFVWDFFTPKNVYLSFSKWIFFLSFLHFCFFLKIIISSQRTGHRSKSEGRGFLSLNLTFLGHGSGLCPKNLLSSKVNSVSYEQFSMGFILHLKMFIYLFQNEYFSYLFFISIFS